MTPEMFKMLNQQANNEMYNHFVYMTMANLYHKAKFNGLAEEFERQSADEYHHSKKIREYLLKFDIEQNVEFTQLEPMPMLDDLFAPLTLSLAIEKTTTNQINALMDKAIELNDHETQSFLQWFVDEQLAEEHEASYRIEQAKLDGDFNPLALRLYNDAMISIQQQL